MTGTPDGIVPAMNNEEDTIMFHPEWISAPLYVGPTTCCGRRLVRISVELIEDGRVELLACAPPNGEGCGTVRVRRLLETKPSERERAS